ncbi:hypothetical protein AWENTII_007325 [Aspergillus wentii]|nr:hypothetical protein MW887_011455 [Aspergillus wentii]
MRGGHDSSGAYEDTPLHSAARAGSVGCVRLLLRRGADVNAVDYIGRTPLYHAAENGDGSVIQLLVGCGARIGTVDDMRESALWEAAKHGNVEGVRLLLGSGVDHRNQYGDTVLHAGAYGGSDEIMKLHIDAGADITAHSRTGTSSLHCPAEGGKAELVKWLLDSYTFDVNEYTSHGWAPILLAALHNDAATARVFLDHGAGIGTSSISGFSPLHLACRYTKLNDHHRPETDDTELIEMLLYNGADIMALASESIGSAWGGEKGEYMQEKFSARIQNYQPVNPSHHRIFPLHCAATSGSITKTRFLLDHGAEINATDYLGQTALFDTFETSPELYRFMLDRGADLNLVDRRGLTAVQSFCFACGPRGTRSFLTAADAYDPSMDW